MRKLNVLRFAVLIGVVAFISACQESLIPNEQEVALKSAELKSADQDNGFVHGIVVEVDDTDYYLKGPADSPDDKRDVPGHYWVKAGKDKLVGKHYNTGPFGMPQWWSSDAPDGELLFKVDAIIDEWTYEKAERYAERGFVHYHELVKKGSDESLHPKKVVWLKHIARTTFSLDGPPVQNMHDSDGGEKIGISISPGVAYNFMPNWDTPYHGNAH